MFGQELPGHEIQAGVVASNHGLHSSSFGCCDVPAHLEIAQLTAGPFDATPEECRTEECGRCGSLGKSRVANDRKSRFGGGNFRIFSGLQIGICLFT